MCSAISRRTPRSGTRRSPGRGSGNAAAAGSVAHVLLGQPSHRAGGRDGREVDPRVPARSAERAACPHRPAGACRTCGSEPLGVAPTGGGLIRRFLHGADLGSEPLTPSPMTTITVPTGTTSPSPARIFATVPAAGDGISTVVLSVWISTSGSSSATSCPSGDEPAGDLTLGQALAEVGELELVGHRPDFYRIASSRSTACTPFTR